MTNLPDTFFPFRIVYPLPYTVKYFISPAPKYEPFTATVSNSGHSVFRHAAKNGTVFNIFSRNVFSQGFEPNGAISFEL
jgi:hypothetical protein